MSDILFQPAVAMAKHVCERRISSVELVEAHLRQIERLNPKLNAFIEVDAEVALRAARAADSALARGVGSGQLHGVPISVKSSVEVAGLRCEGGSRLRAGHVASRDAALVSRLRAAGAIILGNTNTPEMLMAWETDNDLYGRTNSPWDLDRTPGGSSGGEAAAIAAGMSAGGVGSDGGGSIRVPAHFSGICGLKPTPGRIPSSGHYPPSSGPFSFIGVVGPMARFVADLKVLFEIMQGPDVGDAYAAPVPVRWPDVETLHKLRVGYFEDDDRTPVTPETRAAVRSAADSLRAAGFEVESFRPSGLEEVRQLWWQFFGIAGGMLLRPMFAGGEVEMSPLLRKHMDQVAVGPAHTGESLLQAWVRRDLIRAEFLKQMRKFPVLLCPAAAIPAFRHGERSWNVEGRTVEYLDAWSYAEWFNLLGNPAVVVPVGRSPEGLTIGVQIVGRPFEEEQVLMVAETIEQAHGPWRRPSLDWM